MLELRYKQDSETEYGSKYKPARIHPRYVQPVDLTDTWNGVTYLAQRTSYDSYYVEFVASNDELNDFINIVNSDELIVRDNEQDIEITADKSRSDSFIFNEPEEIGGNSWKISFIFKNQRSTITKVIPSGTTSNSITVNSNTYYSDYETIDININVEQLYEKNENVQEILVKSTFNKGQSIIFYNTPAVIKQLKEDLNDFASPSINGTTFYKYEIIEDTLLGDDLYKLVLNCYTDIDIQFPVLNLADVNVVRTAYDNGTSVTTTDFGTPFEIAEITEDTESEKSSNNDGVSVLDRAVTRQIKQLKFFYLRTNANSLKKEFERAQTITINPTGTPITVLENRIVSTEDFGDGMTKLIVDCLFVSDVIYPSAEAL